MLDKGFLGETLLKITYKGDENYPCMVPAKSREAHLKHLAAFRGDLFTEGVAQVVEEEEFMLTGRANRIAWYTSKTTGEKHKVNEGSELILELGYQFTSYQRGGEAPKPSKAMVLQAIADNTWTFAKTAAKSNPHEYALRKRWHDQALSFEDFVLAIRGYGHQEKYMSRLYRCLTVGDHVYWTMGAPLAITILINRKKAHDENLRQPGGGV